jgi:SAM-dependent methyltransferase
MNDDIKDQLRSAYNSSANQRQQGEVASWKLSERQAFFDLLRSEGKDFLLEIGAGPGKDSEFFQNEGLEVISTDLSPQMVQLCRDKGLTAYEVDFLNLNFPDSHFDAVYALNCLLHVPKTELPNALKAIHRILRPSGLFFLGLYGGFDQEGVWEKDNHNPKRFFAFNSDDRLLDIVGQSFHLQDFKRIAVPGLSHPDMIFQRLILRKELSIDTQLL